MNRMLVARVFGERFKVVHSRVLLTALSRRTARNNAKRAHKVSNLAEGRLKYKYETPSQKSAKSQSDDDSKSDVKRTIEDKLGSQEIVRYLRDHGRFITDPSLFAVGMRVCWDKHRDLTSVMHIFEHGKSFFGSGQTSSSKSRSSSSSTNNETGWSEYIRILCETDNLELCFECLDKMTNYGFSLDPHSLGYLIKAVSKRHSRSNTDEFRIISPQRVFDKLKKGQMIIHHSDDDDNDDDHSDDLNGTKKSSKMDLPSPSDFVHLIESSSSKLRMSSIIKTMLLDYCAIRRDVSTAQELVLYGRHSSVSSLLNNSGDIKKRRRIISSMIMKNPEQINSLRIHISALMKVYAHCDFASTLLTLNNRDDYDDDDDNGCSHSTNTVTIDDVLYLDNLWNLIEEELIKLTKNTTNDETMKCSMFSNDCKYTASLATALIKHDPNPDRVIVFDRSLSLIDSKLDTPNKMIDSIEDKRYLISIKSHLLFCQMKEMLLSFNKEDEKDRRPSSSSLNTDNDDYNNAEDEIERVFQLLKETLFNADDDYHNNNHGNSDDHGLVLTESSSLKLLSNPKLIDRMLSAIIIRHAMNDWQLSLPLLNDFLKTTRMLSKKHDYKADINWIKKSRKWRITGLNNNNNNNNNNEYNSQKEKNEDRDNCDDYNSIDFDRYRSMTQVSFGGIKTKPKHIAKRGRSSKHTDVRRMKHLNLKGILNGHQNLEQSASQMLSNNNNHNEQPNGIITLSVDFHRLSHETCSFMLRMLFSSDHGDCQKLNEYLTQYGCASVQISLICGKGLHSNEGSQQSLMQTIIDELQTWDPPLDCHIDDHNVGRLLLDSKQVMDFLNIHYCEQSSEINQPSLSQSMKQMLVDSIPFKQRSTIKGQFCPKTIPIRDD